MSKPTLKSQAARIAELEAENQALRTRLEARSTNSRVRRSEYVAPAPSAAQLERQAKMAAARDEAMRTGRCVQVLS